MFIHAEHPQHFSLSFIVIMIEPPMIRVKISVMTRGMPAIFPALNESRTHAQEILTGCRFDSRALMWFLSVKRLIRFVCLLRGFDFLKSVGMWETFCRKSARTLCREKSLWKHIRRSWWDSRNLRALRCRVFRLRMACRQTLYTGRDEEARWLSALKFSQAHVQIFSAIRLRREDNKIRKPPPMFSIITVD